MLRAYAHHDISALPLQVSALLYDQKPMWTLLMIIRRALPHLGMALGLLISRTLAQPNTMGGVIGWSLVLIVLLIGGTAAVLRLRRWMKEDDAPAGIGFTLSDLRQLHKQGKMTDAEYEKARGKMVEAGKAM